MDSLSVALPVFFASAVVVVLAGVGLAYFGDEIAERTGWGALWVGTILVSVATSLPELITNLSAVIIDAPDIALGNVFGANAINMFTLAAIAAVFGVGRLFREQPTQTLVLALAAVVLALVTLGVTVTGDVALGPSSVGGLIIAASYVGAMRVVYSARAKVSKDPDALPDIAGTATRAWIGFGIASLAIIVTAPLLARSADGIASASGLSASFVGVLLVSIVTTLPEATVSVTAMLRNSPGLVMGNIFGSCAFNLFVIPIADLANGEPLLASAGPEHYLALAAAAALMAAGLVAMVAAARKRLVVSKALVPVMLVGYLATIYGVFVLAG
jgi:cation:H+ antiporter